MSATPLAGRIVRLIEAAGPLSIGEYMAICLGDPAHGYYTTRDPFGAGGDFITAPEVSQMFGEIVGAWLHHAWELAGAPAAVNLVELGPGRGTLMADVLRVAGHRSRFRDALSVHLVETSPALQARQAERLAASGVAVAWHRSLDGVPAGPLLLVANEFLDALPVRQFVRRDGAWHERRVGLDGDGRLAFGLGPASPDIRREAAEGSVLEICAAAESVTTQIAARIAADGGAALLIDYGHAGGLGDTLQAVRGHRPADPLAQPGEADLTAHVDFAALAAAARAAQAVPHGPMPQGAFLLALGLGERAARLAAGADAGRRTALAAAVERLTAPQQMGQLFKAMAVTAPGIVPPPFGGAV